MNTKLNKIHGSCFCSFSLHLVFSLSAIVAVSTAAIAVLVRVSLTLCALFACFARNANGFGSCAYLDSIQFMNDKVKQCCFIFGTN